MTSRDKKPVKPSTRRPGGIRTLPDLNRPTADDSDSDSDGPQEYYTGGEKRMALGFTNSHNVNINLDLEQPGSDQFHEAMQFLRGSYLNHALTANPTIYEDLIRGFWVSAHVSDDGKSIIATINDQQVTINEENIRRSLELNDEHGITTMKITEVRALFERMGYEGDYHKGMVKKGMVGMQWRYLMHMFIVSISSRRGGQDEINTHLQVAFVTFCSRRIFNFSNYIFLNMSRNITEPRYRFLLYPRFIQMILDTFFPNLPRGVNTFEVKPTNKIVFSQMKKNTARSKFSNTITPLWAEMINPVFETPAQAQQARILEQEMVVDENVEQEIDEHVQIEGEPEPVTEAVINQDQQFNANQIIQEVVVQLQGNVSNSSSETPEESRLPTRIGPNPLRGLVIYFSSSSEESVRKSPPGTSPKTTQSVNTSPAREVVDSTAEYELFDEPSLDINSPERHASPETENIDSRQETTSVVLKAEVILLRSQLTELQSEVVNLRAEVTSSHADVSESKVEMTFLKEEVTSSKAAVKVLTAEVISIRAEVISLRTELELLKAELTSLRAEKDQNIKPQHEQTTINLPSPPSIPPKDSFLISELFDLVKSQSRAITDLQSSSQTKEKEFNDLAFKVSSYADDLGIINSYLLRIEQEKPIFHDYSSPSPEKTFSPIFEPLILTGKGDKGVGEELNLEETGTSINVEVSNGEHVDTENIEANNDIEVERFVSFCYEALEGAIQRWLEITILKSAAEMVELFKVRDLTKPPYNELKAHKVQDFLFFKQTTYCHSISEKMINLEPEYNLIPMRYMPKDIGCSRYVQDTDMDEEDRLEDLKIKEKWMEYQRKEERVVEEFIKLDQLRELVEAINRMEDEEERKKAQNKSEQEKKKRIRAFLIKKGYKHQRFSRLNLETLQKLQFDINYEEAEQLLGDMAEDERMELSLKISFGEMTHEDVPEYVKKKRYEKIITDAIPLQMIPPQRVDVPKSLEILPIEAAPTPKSKSLITPPTKAKEPTLIYSRKAKRRRSPVTKKEKFHRAISEFDSENLFSKQKKRKMSKKERDSLKVVAWKYDHMSNIFPVKKQHAIVEDLLSEVHTLQAEVSSLRTENTMILSEMVKMKEDFDAHKVEHEKILFELETLKRAKSSEDLVLRKN